MQKDLEDLKSKISNVNDLEKKIKKKLQGMSENSDFAKMIAEKADGDETRKEFSL